MPPNDSRRKVLLGVAWPYSNGSLHIGQIVGAYLPADIFARYHRAAGNEVLMVSGSDQHGTPITVRAEQEGTTAAEVAARFHAEFLESWERLGISWDLYTTTGTDNHIRVVQDIFLKLLERGDIFEDTMELPYCAVEQRFLLDRYVEGTCPHCGDPNARGDQCDNCGRILDPLDLIDRRCKFDGSEPEIRESRHFFLRLSAYNDRLKEWLATDKEYWRTNVKNFSLGILDQGLQDRAITRDIEWGIPIPVPGWEDKRIYVWFENVIGYLSAAIEWAEATGQPDRWREFWLDPECHTYYFIGKDNIFFHTLSWPMELMSYREAIGDSYNLPYDVPANQYQTIRGSKASTSRRLAVFVPDFLSRYEADPLRYYLAATMPETSDSDFTWADFLRRNNDELVATWGNLVNRVLTFTYRNFDRAVPNAGELTGQDQELLSRAERAIAEAGEHIELCHFRAGLEAGMSAAREANRYVEDNAPWQLLKEDRARCATVLHTAIGAIAGINVALSPYLPFSSQTLHGYLGSEGPLSAVGWRFVPPRAGQPLAEAQPLFKKLDPKIVEEEEARMAA
jgi:methionyl-tRNA synthetase